MIHSYTGKLSKNQINKQNLAVKRAYGKIRVSPRIERARVICQRPRKNFGKERAFDAFQKLQNFEMLKIFENFENYDARHFLWEITNEARTSFPIKNSRSPIELSVIS